MTDHGVLLIGEGPRDEAIVTPLVANTPSRLSVTEFKTWRDQSFNRQSGFAKKLLFAILAARVDGFDGVIATVDRDNLPDGQRLADLATGRNLDRTDLSKTHLPCAIGEARPHAEAWLLDDEKAVRAALGMASSDRVPSVGSTKDPKSELDVLMSAHRPGSDKMKLLGEIAERLDRGRCNHASDTGLDDFLDDVELEFAA